MEKASYVFHFWEHHNELASAKGLHKSTYYEHCPAYAVHYGKCTHLAFGCHSRPLLLPDLIRPIALSFPIEQPLELSLLGLTWREE